MIVGFLFCCQISWPSSFLLIHRFAFIFVWSVWRIIFFWIILWRINTDWITHVFTLTVTHHIATFAFITNIIKAQTAASLARSTLVRKINNKSSQRAITRLCIFRNNSTIWTIKTAQVRSTDNNSTRLAQRMNWSTIAINTNTINFNISFSAFTYIKRR